MGKTDRLTDRMTDDDALLNAPYVRGGIKYKDHLYKTTSLIFTARRYAKRGICRRRRCRRRVCVCLSHSGIVSICMKTAKRRITQIIICVILYVWY